MGKGFRFVCGNEGGEMVYRSEDKKIVCRKKDEGDDLGFFLNKGGVKLFVVNRNYSDLNAGVEASSTRQGERWLEDNGYSPNDLGSFLYDLAEGNF